MNFSKFIRSFVYAFQGLMHAVRTEQNLKIHSLVAIAVTVAGFVLALTTWEWIAIVLCIGMVISAECMNCAIERLADRITRDTDPLIKQAKDCGSAAVFVLAIAAAIVGGLVFIPKIWAALVR